MVPPSPAYREERDFKIKMKLHIISMTNPSDVSHSNTPLSVVFLSDITLCLMSNQCLRINVMFLTWESETMKWTSC
jgi:hypothetical protein